MSAERVGRRGVDASSDSAPLCEGSEALASPPTEGGTITARTVGKS
eukprot:CAMPEP_0115748310 /NCGR_PEP_ID=MMETSP0272-20121206/93606_1 /TAXON_ID=71861 /ORGANISM="Scrippsiella trochoidea, Strain CCMP3099" /LENGTH=45 /DNA_ID= /DNA_START= /DNA_END= /DNA_ORIENTATION=